MSARVPLSLCPLSPCPPSHSSSGLLSSMSPSICSHDGPQSTPAPAVGFGRPGAVGLPLGCVTLPGW